MKILVFEFCNLASRAEMLRAYEMQAQGLDVQVLGATELEPKLDGPSVIARIKTENINGVLLSGLPRTDDHLVERLITRLVRAQVPTMVVSSNSDWLFRALKSKVLPTHVLHSKEHAISTFAKLLQK